MKHRFFLVFRPGDGTPAFEEPVTDFAPLFHDVAFRGVCRNSVPNDGLWGDMMVEPIWRRGQLAGIGARVGSLSRCYGLSVFADQATELLVTHQSRDTHDTPPEWNGTIRVRYEAIDEAPRARRSFVRRQPYPLIDRAQCPAALPDRERKDRRSSVLLASGLVEDLKAISADSLEEERADFLTGYVVRHANGATSVVVLDRIAADTETTQSLVHFGFSAQTFAAAQRALAARGGDQVMVGWSHNHPPPCGRKCLMIVPACRTENVFFSVADRAVHRTGFSNPYMVALVWGKGANRRVDDPILRAYGWRHGLIRERTFTVF